MELASQHIEELRPIFRAQAAHAARVSASEVSTWHSAYGLLPVRQQDRRRVYSLADVIAIAIVGEIRARSVALGAAMSIANALRPEVIPNAMTGGPNIVVATQTRGQWAFEVIREGDTLRAVAPFHAGFAFVLDLSPIIDGVIARLREMEGAA